jgi:hypothetical protein
VELNGRGGEDPWSLRQCGIYQQIDLITRRSKWIILQRSGTIRSKLEETLRTQSDKTEAIHAIVPHIIFVSIMAANWQSYVEYLNMQLAALVRREEINLIKLN